MRPAQPVIPTDFTLQPCPAHCWCRTGTYPGMGAMRWSPTNPGERFPRFGAREETT